MRAIVLQLTEQQIAEIINTLESFPAVNHQPTLSGDLKHGAFLYREHCMECHRFNGQGEIVFRSAHISGMQDWYLLAQWQKFKTGIRGYHPDDEAGAKIRKVTSHLQNDTDAQDVILYISTLAQKYPLSSQP